jgi:hypothetical protein
MQHECGEEERVWFVVGNPEGRRPLGRPRCRRMNNIKMDLEDTGWGSVDWIGLDFVKAVMKFRVQ